MHYESPVRNPLILGDKSYSDITNDIAKPVESKAPRSWWIAFSIAFVMFLWGVGCILYTIGTGIGVWGLNKTIDWAWMIRPRTIVYMNSGPRPIGLRPMCRRWPRPIYITIWLAGLRPKSCHRPCPAQHAPTWHVPTCIHTAL